MTIRVVCQYCARFMGEKDGGGVSGVSHGICGRCKKLPEDEQLALYHARQPARPPRRESEHD